MSAVLEAYNALMAIAGSGPEFVHGNVYHPTVPANHPRMSQVIGRGYDWTRIVPVADQYTGATVQATASLRLIRMDGEVDGVVVPGTSLFIRARLSWVTSRGGSYASYACYDITPQAAVVLSRTAPTVDDGPSDAEFDQMTPEKLVETAFGAVSEAMSDAGRYNADWIQTLPPGEEGWPSNEDSEYHSKTVLAAIADQPLLLCMLSDMDLGGVEPQELGNLLTWINQHLKPKVTSG
jgi:hypothetical protein